MTSEEARNKAMWEVAHNLGPSNTNDMSAAVREKYEAERAYQEKQQKQQADKK